MTRTARWALSGLGAAVMVVAMGRGEAGAHERGVSESALTSAAQRQIATAFHALVANGSHKLLYLQGYDGAMATAGLEATSAQTQEDGSPVSSESVEHIKRASRSVATATLTFSEHYPREAGPRAAFFATAVEIDGHWKVSWSTQCALVEAAGIPCPPTPRGVTGTVPAPYELVSSPPSASADPGLIRPGALAVAPDGSLLIVDVGRDQILRREPDGTLFAFAGDGFTGFSGDGGPAVDAMIDVMADSSLAVSPNGTVYFSDTANNRVRAISPNGTIETVAQLEQPAGLALSPGGLLYVADESAVSEIRSNGTIATLVTGGPPTGVDVEASGQTFAFFPTYLALDASGDLDVFTDSPKMLLEIPAGPSGPNASAMTVLGEDYANQMSTTPSGTVIVADHGGGLEEVVGHQLQEIFNAITTSVTGYGAAGTPDSFINPHGVAVALNGTIYADTSSGDGYTASGLMTIAPSGQASVLPIENSLVSLPTLNAPGFAAATYPAPTPSESGSTLASCPSLAGLVSFTPAALAKAKSDAAQFDTGFFTTLQSSDRSWWPMVFTEWTVQESELGRHTVEGSVVAMKDLAAASLARVCGKELVRRSMVVEIGRSAYSASVGHLFFLDRGGTPLVYFQGI